jgi:hypothetical protein
MLSCRLIGRVPSTVPPTSAVAPPSFFLSVAGCHCMRVVLEAPDHDSEQMAAHRSVDGQLWHPVLLRGDWPDSEPRGVVCQAAADVAGPRRGRPEAPGNNGREAGDRRASAECVRDSRGSKGLPRGRDGLLGGVQGSPVRGGCADRPDHGPLSAHRDADGVLRGPQRTCTRVGTAERSGAC